MPKGPYWDKDQMAIDNEFPTILALGDSWFHYPPGNLLNPIFALASGNDVIYCQGKNGIKAEELLDDFYRRNFIADLKGYKRVHTVLLSAGGNDFAGIEELTSLLERNCSRFNSAEDCFRKGQPGRMLNKVIGYFDELVALVRKNRPNAKVLVHNYDYAIPNGKGFLGFGQWLKAPMDVAKVRKPNEWGLGSLRRNIIGTLVNEFGRKLDDFANQSKGRVIFMRTAGRITADGNWANELHPTRRGFRQLGKAYRGYFNSLK